MTWSAPKAVLDAWFDRYVSLGLLLVAASILALAKIMIVLADLNGMPTSQWFTSMENDPVLSASLEAPILDEEKFIPWPSVLPEPAAGSEGANDGSSSDNGRPASIEPSTLTEGERTALQQLAARRQALDEREEMLDMRAELNGRLEQKLDQQIAQLTELKNQLQAMVKGLDESEELKVARLVKIYETMKPKAAAAIFNRLELSVLLHVIERMKESKLASILEKMDPVIAKRITTELAQKKERPQLVGSAFGDDA